jgi:uncharacterized membrane protein
MNALTSLGKYLFAIPFAVFGVIHLMNADAMAGMVPIPGGAIWIYITGIAHIAAAIAIVIGKYDRLAAMLLGVMLIIFALSIQLPVAIESGWNDMTNLLKDISLTGGAWIYAGYASTDSNTRDL